MILSDRDPVTSRIIGFAIEVHRWLGPGLLESAYEECLCHELLTHGVPHQRQVPLALRYKGIRLECGYRMDLVVADEVIVEVKTVDRFLPVHEAQLLSYLRLLDKRVGLLLNFKVPLLTQGVRRKVNGF